MKKAINQWCFPAEWSWERVFAACREERFEGIELCVDYQPFLEAMRSSTKEGIIAEIAKSVGSGFERSKSLSFDSSPAELEAVGDLARRHGVSVVSLTAIAQFHYALTETDDELWKTGIELTRRLVRMAALLGAPSVLVIPGLVSSRVSYDSAFGRLKDALAALLPDAEAAGVTLALENVWGKILYSPLEMRDLVDSYGSPRVGVHFDVGNVMQFGYPDQWIRILGKRIAAVHLKDYRTDIDNIRGFTHLFLGDVPWARVMEALGDTGYAGSLIAEVPPYAYSPEEGIRDVSRKMDILMGR
jgi:L-ribulose-5-phosphate 3-epimerase